MTRERIDDAQTPRPQARQQSHRHAHQHDSQHTMSPMSPICLTKLMLKSFAVWVLVSSGEFSNIASIVLAVASARALSVSLRMKKFVLPFMPNLFASSK